MSFIDSVTSTGFLKIVKDVDIQGFSVRDEALYFQCPNCTVLSSCMDLLGESLFPLNAIFSPSFRSFQNHFEHYLISAWHSSETRVLIAGGFKEEEISFEDFYSICDSNMGVSLLPSCLLLQLSFKLETVLEDGIFPVLIWNPIDKVMRASRINFSRYFEKGVSGFCMTCYCQSSFIINEIGEIVEINI